MNKVEIIQVPKCMTTIHDCIIQAKILIEETDEYIPLPMELYHPRTHPDNIINKKYSEKLTHEAYSNR